jgi:hypothetical protein
MSSAQQRTPEPAATARLLFIPGSALAVAGFLMIVFAYAGRARGNMPLAFGGLLLLLGGIGMCLAAATMLIVRNVSDKGYRVVHGVRVCPGCGRQANTDDRFCPGCGRTLSVLDEGESISATPAAGAANPSSPSSTEQVLFSFGPFGTDVCNGPYRVFSTWHRRHSMIVELTNMRLCVLPNRHFGFLSIPAMKYPWGTRLPLEIPYGSIVSVELQKHPSPIALMEVLDIKYNEGGGVQEKCIAGYTDKIRRAYDTLIAATQALPGSQAAFSPRPAEE